TISGWHSTSRSTARPLRDTGSRAKPLRESSCSRALDVSRVGEQDLTEALMRRIAITLTVLALVAGAFGCSSDGPTPPQPKPPGGQNPNGSSALQIRLFTSNPNPSAGTCTLIQAIVTLNGNNVP